MYRATALFLVIGVSFMAAKTKAQPKPAKAAEPIEGVKVDASGKLPKGTVSEPWNEVVKYEVIDPKTDNAVKTVDAVDAFRVPSGKLVLRLKQTVAQPQPGCRVTTADGVVITIKSCRSYGTALGATMIDDPIPPTLKPGTIVPFPSVSKATKK